MMNTNHAIEFDDTPWIPFTRKLISYLIATTIHEYSELSADISAEYITD